MQETTWKLSDVSFEKSFVYTLLELLFVGEKTSQLMRGTVRHELTSFVNELASFSCYGTYHQILYKAALSSNTNGEVLITTTKNSKAEMKLFPFDVRALPLLWLSKDANL